MLMSDQNFAEKTVTRLFRLDPHASLVEQARRKTDHYGHIVLAEFLLPKQSATLPGAIVLHMSSDSGFVVHERYDGDTTMGYHHGHYFRRLDEAMIMFTRKVQEWTNRYATYTQNDFETVLNEVANEAKTMIKESS